VVATASVGPHRSRLKAITNPDPTGAQLMAGALTRWDPFAEITDLRRRFDRLFDDLGRQRHDSWSPAIDVLRQDGRLTVRADLPGITPEEVKIEVEDGVLTVSGEHEERRSEKDDDGGYVRRERRFGAFSRSIVLPSGVDAQAIKAETRDGVVEVTIPVPSDSTKQAIQVTSASPSEQEEQTRGPM
jgi:HSP20 family protein